MIMLGKYITVNGEPLPNPVSGSFEYSLNPAETIFENEAGEQMANVKRLDRVSWGASFQCTSGTRDKLIALCKLAEVVCTVDGVQYSGRLRLGGAVSLYERSETVPNTRGLWTLSLTFEEF